VRSRRTSATWCFYQVDKNADKKRIRERLERCGIQTLRALTTAHRLQMAMQTICMIDTVPKYSPVQIEYPEFSIVMVVVLAFELALELVIVQSEIRRVARLIARMRIKKRWSCFKNLDALR
jgi:hypothetical protein